MTEKRISLGAAAMVDLTFLRQEGRTVEDVILYAAVAGNQGDCTDWRSTAGALVAEADLDPKRVSAVWAKLESQGWIKEASPGHWCAMSAVRRAD